MTKILVLGAGFGGLELCTLLSEALGDSIEVRLIDKNDHFVFGFSKLDIMFGHAKPQAVRLPYANFTKSGVQLTRRIHNQNRPRGEVRDDECRKLYGRLSGGRFGRGL